MAAVTFAAQQRRRLLMMAAGVAACAACAAGDGGDRTIFDVFARTGEFRHTVVLPRAIHVEPTPFLSATTVIGVTTDPLTDESVVLRFEAAGYEATGGPARSVPTRMPIDPYEAEFGRRQ